MLSNKKLVAPGQTLTITAMGTTGSKIVFLIVASSLVGCGLQKTAFRSDPIILDRTGAADIAEKMDYSGLAAVLKAGVGRGGELTARELSEQSKTLEDQLVLMSAVGPKMKPHLFETREARLVYWYNARAAWALKLLMTFSLEHIEDSGGVSQTVRSSLGKLFSSDDDDDEPETMPANTLTGRPFPLDSRTMTLADIDSLLEEQFGWKSAVAAPCVASNRAVIPTKPFDTTDMKNAAELIDRRFNEFVDDRDRFVIDVPCSRILVPPVLWQFGDRILADHKKLYRTTGATLTTALLPHVRLSAHRRLQDAIGYKCVGGPEGQAELLDKLKKD